MEDRKRRISPAGNSSEGHAAQKRKLSSLNISQLPDPTQYVDETSSKSAELDSALGLEEGFLEVSLDLRYNAATTTAAQI